MEADAITIARQVALELCKMQVEPYSPESADFTSLVFPSYRANALNGPRRARVSEAEARVLYCLALDRLKLPFAVEVPTTQQYGFSSTNTMSARTDLVVYASRRDAPGALVRDLAIEFKAHNPGPEAIRKDLEKLLREQCDGLWFHVLQNADSQTIPVLMGKFTQAIEGLRGFWQQFIHTLTLCVVVRERKFWLHRTLAPAHDSTPNLFIDYDFRDKKIVVRDGKGWVWEDF